MEVLVLSREEIEMCVSDLKKVVDNQKKGF